MICSHVRAPAPTLHSQGSYNYTPPRVVGVRGGNSLLGGLLMHTTRINIDRGFNRSGVCRCVHALCLSLLVVTQYIMNI